MIRIVIEMYNAEKKSSYGCEIEKVEGTGQGKVMLVLKF